MKEPKEIYFLPVEQLSDDAIQCIEKVVELPLNEEEMAKFKASAAAVRKTNAALKEVGAL